MIRLPQSPLTPSNEVNHGFVDEGNFMTETIHSFVEKLQLGGHANGGLLVPKTAEILESEILCSV